MKNSKKILILIVVLFILIGVGFFIYSLSSQNRQNTDIKNNLQTTSTIQTADWKSNTQFAGFDKIKAYLKTQNPSVPVLLPTELQGITQKSQYGESVVSLYAAAGVNKDGGYDVSLYYGEDCGGANACFGAAFTAEKGKTMITEGTEQVVLANNIIGYYYPRSCGGSCSPQGIMWVYKGVNYSIQLKTNNEKSILVSWANSAIQNASDK